MMSSVFDGMASILADVFGAPVRYVPAVGEPRDIQSVFRTAPIEVVDQDGHPVLIVSPTWQVQAILAPEAARGDQIEPGNGKIYVIQNVSLSGSPAGDALIICELERVYDLSR